MKIPVAGFDPSLTHWGVAEGTLCLDTGILDNVRLQTAETSKTKVKNVRVNSDDMERSTELAKLAVQVAQRSKVVFVEVPVGSQSANGMKSYGVVLGILGAIQALGLPMIIVGAIDSKRIFTGNKNATKRLMIDTAFSLYPEANWRVRKGIPQENEEHVADAIAAIHAGVQTPVFQQLMRLFAEV